jgi:phosphate transport system substrate-binding protein
MNWKEIGGLDEPITAFQREKDSGSQTGMEQMVMQGVPMLDAPTLQIYSMGALIDAVGEFSNKPTSIGYTYKFYVDNLYQDDNIKILKINSVTPSQANIISKSYPLTVSYYGAVRAGDGKNSAGRKFLDWLLSGQGQASIAQAGYVPLAP